jgi:hypothetical protein
LSLRKDFKRTRLEAKRQEKIKTQNWARKINQPSMTQAAFQYQNLPDPQVWRLMGWRLSGQVTQLPESLPQLETISTSLDTGADEMQVNKTQNA